MKRRMLFAALTLAALCALFVVTASAATRSGDYYYTVSNGEATITDVESYIGGDVTIPSTLDGYPVTSIGYDAFAYLGHLTSVTIPNGVTSIYSDAFSGCSNLTSVFFPEGMVSIGARAFSNCSSLSHVTIPSSVTTIYGAAFNGCSSLTSVVIPNGVTNIDEYTFDGCSSLTSVTIPSSVTSIGNYAFRNCSRLMNVTIPSTVTSIGRSAFSGCSDLTSVTIPASVMSIGDYAFVDCSTLTSITVDSDNPYYADEDGVLFSKAKTVLIKYPAGNAKTSYTIPSSVTSIGNDAFSNCRHLSSVTIPSSVTSIGGAAFSNCSSLSSVTIPSSVTSIDNNAFFNCSRLNIFGYNNSYAETYAASNGYTFYPIDEPAIVTQPASATYSLGDTAVPLTVEITPTPGTVSYAWYKSDENGLLTQLISTDATLTPDTGVAGTSSYMVRVSVTYDGETYTVYSDPVTIEVIDKLSCGDNLTWTLTDGTLTITGAGAMYDYSAESPAPWYADRASITAVKLVNDLVMDDVGNVLPIEITHIGDNAFADCTGLVSMEIPKNLTSIGANAFSGCTNLRLICQNNYAANYAETHGIPYTYITWSEEYSATTSPYVTLHISGRGAMPDYGSDAHPAAAPWKEHMLGSAVKINSSITSIGANAFVNWSKLTITIPPSVTSIHADAFAGSSKITILGSLGSAAETYAKQNGIAFIAVDAFVLLGGDDSPSITCALGDTLEPITVTATSSVGTLSCVLKKQYSIPGLVGEETVVREDSSSTSTLTTSLVPDTSAVGSWHYFVDFTITQAYADGSLYTTSAGGYGIADVNVIESAGTITAATWDKGREWFHISLDDVSAARSLQLVLRDANGNTLTTMEKPAQDPRYLYDEKLNILDPTTGEIALVYNAVTNSYYVEVSAETYRAANEADFAAVDRTNNQSNSFIPLIGEDEYLIDNNGVRWVYKNEWLYVTPAGTLAKLNAYPTSYGEYPTTGQVYNSAGSPTKVLYFHQWRMGWIDDANAPDIPVDQLMDNNGVIWTYGYVTGVWSFRHEGQVYSSANYQTVFGRLPTTAVDAHNNRYTFANGTWYMEGSSLPGIGVFPGTTLPTTPTSPATFPLRDLSFTTFLSTKGSPADGWTQTAWTPAASAVPTTLALIVDGRTVDSFALSVSAADWTAAFPTTPVSPTPTPTEKLTAAWEPDENRFSATFNVTAAESVKLVLKDADGAVLTETEKAISALPVSPSFYITTTASTNGGAQTGINATWYFTTSAYSDVPAWHMLAEGSSELMPWKQAIQFSGIGILGFGFNFGSGTGSDGLTYTWDPTAQTWTYNGQPLGCVSVTGGYLYTNHPNTADPNVADPNALLSLVDMNGYLWTKGLNGNWTSVYASFYTESWPQYMDANGSVWELIDSAWKKTWTQSAWTPTAGRYPDRLELHVDGVCVETCAIAINVADWNAAFPAAPAVPAITGLLVHDQPDTYTTLQLWQNGTVVQTIGVRADAAGAQPFALTDIPAGVYDLHILRPGCLTTVIRGITVNGLAPVDLTAHANPAIRCIELTAGDLNGDGVINVVDVALVRGEEYGMNETSVTLPFAG